MDPRSRYSTPSQKLVLALDIGTTFSGAAYVYVDPGRHSQIRLVTRFLNNPNPWSGKVPSTLYYDHNGNFRGVENGIDFKDSDGLVKVKWWKLMLSPGELPDAMKDQMSGDLPGGKTITDIFADFMRYLFDSAKAQFRSSESNGELKWRLVSKSIELVLAHPNGWGGPQKTQLRNAAVKAGIVTDTYTGRSRVHFVSEGEASFKFCAAHTHEGKNLKPGKQALIIDAGGGTIDITTYKVLSRTPLSIEELCEPKCLVQGSELVTARATAMAKEKLKDSKFNTHEDLAAFSQWFEERVKKAFSNSRADQYIEFSSPKGGRLTLTGGQTSGFFEPSIQLTVDSIKDNFKQCPPTDAFAILVGGFSANPWLFEQLEQRLTALGFQFFRPEMHANKTVAVGAISHYIDQFTTGKYGREDDQIAYLNYENAELQDALEAQDRQVRDMQERLKRTEELLEARTAELSGAQTFLSTADRLSEMEVLSIVRDLNENLFQVAVTLTEEWEKLESSQANDSIEVDLTSKSRDPALVQLARKRDPTGLTYLLQSFLCSQAVEMASSWVRGKEPGGLGSVYRHLSVAEGQAISARWRSLTHSHLSPSPSQSTSMVEDLVKDLAEILTETGSFPSPEESLKFVQTVGLEGIKSMKQTAQRLETAFMVDVTSSDMSLLCGYSGTVFNDAEMTNDFGSDSVSKPGGQYTIAGTTEVGVKKTIWGGRGETEYVEILLKPKIVLEKDVVGDAK